MNNELTTRGGLEEGLPIEEYGIMNTSIPQTANNIDYYGDNPMYGALKDTLRIGLININGIPSNNTHLKNEQVRTAINKNHFDVTAFTEVNRCWHKIACNHRWRQRTQTWWEAAHHAEAFNTNDITTSDFQPGGTLITSINKIAHKIIESGYDKSGLGRWSWTKYRGKCNTMLRIVSLYRCCKPTTPGPSTAYMQQQRYLDAVGSSTNPRKQVLTDIGQLIDKWNETGEQIVILADMNEDITGSNISTWCQQHHLQEAIINKHQETLSLKATYHRGSKPIDGIFVSSNIKILKGGYLEHGEFPSDHRALWIDLKFSDVFGFKMNDIRKPSARRLKCGDPRIRKKWTNEYKKFSKHHKLHTKIFTLEQCLLDKDNTLTEEQQKTLNGLLNLRQQGMRHADKRCRKLKMGMVPYSPELKRIQNTVELWNAAYLRNKGCKYSFKKMIRLEQRCHVYNTNLFSIEYILAQLQEARKKYIETKKKALELRTKFLEDKAQAIADDAGDDAVNIYRQLLRIEAQRSAARNISRTLGKVRGGSITKVDTTINGCVKEITDKTELELACMKSIRKKYTQTQTTPCIQEPLRTLLGSTADTEYSKNILRGNFQPTQGMSKYTIELLQELKQVVPTSTSPHFFSISPESYTSGWKKMSEHTTAGISGLHFGHMKACAQDNLLSQMESSLSSLPFASGMAPESWSKGIALMLQKKIGSTHVDKLRTITLCEADFNYNNKHLGKHTMQHAELLNLIAPEQYGSRSGKSAIEHALHKRLWYDILRQSRRPGAMCSNDAKGCYDRIIHSIASLAYQRIGVPLPPVKSMLRTIQQMKHYIRTGYGDSAMYLDSNNSLNHFQGILQGNGAAPTTWVVISTPLLNMLRSANNGSFLVSPLSKNTHHMVGFAFVDDTDLPTTDMRSLKTTEQTMEDMQETIHRWEGGLKATGGAIAPEKSWVYPIAFKFDDDGIWSYQTTEEIGATFMVKDEKEIMQELTQYNSSKGKETLGVFLAPDGNNLDMITALREKTEKWAALVQSGRLPQYVAWQALETTILKSITYPLLALTLNKRDCQYIMAPALKAGLNAAKISSKFPRDVLFGDKLEGGLGLTDIYHEQGQAHIHIIQKHLDTSTLTGQLLRNTIEGLKLEAGIGDSIFDKNYNKYSNHVTDCWAKHLWKYVDENNITIQDNVTENLHLQRINDKYIMESIINREIFKTKELQIINNCRIYLQVTSLADIVTGTGNIFTDTYKCQRDTQRHSDFTWPYQSRPGPRARRLWKRALCKCFLNEERRLSNPLGAWTRLPNSWQWFYSHHTQCLYQRRRKSWRIWRRTRRLKQGYKMKFKRFSSCIGKPADAKPATISMENDIALLTGATPLQENYDRSSPHSQWGGAQLLRNTKTPKPSTYITIRNAIWDNALYMVTDGSYIPETSIGTAAWITETDRDSNVLQGKVHCPGPDNEQCAYRSELTGILCGMLHILATIDYDTTIRGLVTLYCDCKGAIEAIKNRYKIAEPNRPHYDIIQAIWKLQDNSNITWKLKHVKGHQDSIYAMEELTKQEKLNIQVDAIAKAYAHQLHGINASTPHTTLPFQKLQIRTEIDWQVLHKSYASLPLYQRWKLSKWKTHFCGTGKKLQERQYQRYSSCPFCLSPHEDTRHILQCLHPSACDNWNENMAKIHTWMTNNKGDPDMIQNIVGRLNGWRRGEPAPDNLSTNPTLQLAIRHQNRIGWENLLEGFISKEWRKVQHHYLTTINSPRSAVCWWAKAQRQIWNLILSMWDNRCKFLHEREGETIHKREQLDTTRAILNEWNKGRENLPSSHQNLFQGSILQRTTDTCKRQKQWLTSVWIARERYTPNTNPRYPNNTAYDSYNKWKKRKWKEDDNDAPPD